MTKKPKLYQYTILRQNGTMKRLKPCPKKQFRGPDGLYQLLGCTTIEIIPKDYYADKLWAVGRVTVYGDEEARFNSNNHRNLCFKVLRDEDEFANPIEFDVVGDCVMEQVAK